MEEDKGHKNWLIYVVILGILTWFLFFKEDKYEGQTAEEWFNAYDYETARNEELENKLTDYQTALEEANQEIEDAKWYTWESYEDMGNALDGLDTVPEP